MGRALALALLGDVMLGRNVNDSLALAGALESVWGDMLPLLQGGVSNEGEECVVAGNLECAVTQEENKVPKEFNFRLFPAHAGALKTARFSFLSLANNHSLDYGEAGLRETMVVLGQQGIAFAGAGLAEQASRPAVISRAGLRLAFFSYSDHPKEWEATLERMGINSVDPSNFDPDRIRAQLAPARGAGADLVVVFVHWGPNWQWLPSRAIQRLGHAFIDCGADLVFGHSSHHIQGIEIYKHRPIIYGAGGWIDDYRLHDDFRNDLGFLYCCHIRDGVPSHLELIPSKISHIWQASGSRPPYLSTVAKADGEDRQWLERTLKRLCSNFGTAVADSPRGWAISLASLEAAT